MNCRISKKIISMHIICLIILLNIFQLGISFTNINFNMFYIEYILVGILSILNRFKVKNHKNMLLIFFTLFLFLASFVLFNNIYLEYYFKEFLIYAMPILIIFLYEIDYRLLAKIFNMYCILLTLLYMFNLFINSPLLNSYMDFGYNGMFCTSYVLIYNIFNKKKISIIFSSMCSVLLFIYGSRGAAMVFLIALFLTLFIKTKNTKKNLLFLSILILITLLLSNNNIIISFINFLSEKFGNTSYVVKQLYNMINSDNIFGALGGRYYIYLEALEEIEKNFFLGGGIAGFQTKYGYFPHNIFLDVYCTFGFIFGTMYFCFLIYISIKYYKINKNYPEKLILFVFCLSICFKLMLSKTFIYDPYIWLLISIFLNGYSEQKQ